MPTKPNGSGLFIGTYVSVDTLVAAFSVLNARGRNQERVQGQIDCHLLYLANMDLRGLPDETKDRIGAILLPAVNKQVGAYELYATAKEDPRKGVYDRLMSFKLSLEDALGVSGGHSDGSGPKTKPLADHHIGAH